MYNKKRGNKMFEFKKGDTLLVVDVQNDFLPCGRLAVKRADRIIPYINAHLTNAYEAGALIILTMDWHPENHISFKEWGTHCVAGTYGAQVSKDLNVKGDYLTIYKGTEIDKDQYSPFDNTELNRIIKNSHDLNEFTNRILIVGLAFDVCVIGAIDDAYRFGYDVYTDLKSTKAVTPTGHTSTIDYIMNKEIATFI